MSGLMCSYNSVNNVPSCASNWLLRDVARGAWGFSGYVVADCDADSDVFTAHHYERTPEATVRDVLQAGTDLDCGGFVSRYVKSALDKNLLSERDIDERLENQCECQFRVYSTLTSPVFLVGSLVFLSSTLTLGTCIGCLLSTVHGPSCDADINMAAVEVRVRFGHFDPPNPLDKITPEDNICTEETQALAKDGVTQSVALLKNTAGAGLPWTAATKIRRVAVLGPNGNAALPNSDKAYYGPGNTCGGRVFSVVDAVAQHLASPQVVLYACGVPSIAHQFDQ
eukprot:COSAG01_NODE_10207_length_2222_cov_1.839378_2_plen_282_part_00